MEEQLAELAALLPDFAERLPQAKAELVLLLVRDLPGLAARLVALRDALPNSNVSELVAAQPQLMLRLTVRCF